MMSCDDRGMTKFDNNDDQRGRKNVDNYDDECVVMKRSCIKHNLPAVQMRKKKTVWTKIKKSGLYGYRTRTSITWVCPSDNPVGPESSQFERESGKEINPDRVGGHNPTQPGD